MQENEASNLITLYSDVRSMPDTPVFESKIEKAAFLIKEMLSHGDMASKEIYVRLENEGISHRTAEDTKKAIGVRCYRKMRKWYWSLRPEEGENHD